MKPRAFCTAVLVAGAVTQRIDRVIRPTREARDLIARAERIGKEGRIDENPRRLGLCEPHPDSGRRPFRVVTISIYCDELARLDALVAKARRNGDSKMSRSKLLRAAVRAIAGEAAARRIA